MRIAEIDSVLTKLYGNNALRKKSDKRFEKMSITYEIEKKELYAAISQAEKDIEEAEQENVDLKVFLQTIRQCTDLKELKPTIVNTMIKRTDVHNPDEKELLYLMDEIHNEKNA